MVTRMKETIEIIFTPGRIMIGGAPAPIAAVPCPDELQEDVYFYLIGALTGVIRDGVKGAEEFHRG